MPPERGGALPVIPLLVRRQLGFKFTVCLENGAVEVGREMKGTDLYLAKRGSGEITFFVATRTNLLSYSSLTHARGGMDSIGSKSVSL